jgi:transposase
MTLNSRIQIPLPENDIIVRSTAPYYVYKVVGTFRNKKGKPDNNRRLIGRLDPGTGMLIPNGNYYELFNTTTVGLSLSINNIRSIGATFLIGCILEDLGVSRILREVFGEEKANAIMTAAIYMSCMGNVFEHVLDWCEGYTLHETILTSQKSSSLFASISHADRMSFFKSWIEVQKQTPEFLAYDVTSFSSYAKGIEDTEWGYNRDGDRLPQLNLGCYMCKDSGTPLFYITYPGSIVDKSHLPYMMAYNDELGIKDMGFVLDKGFCSTDNICFMQGAHYRFAIGVEISHKATRAAVDEVRDGIVSMKNCVSSGTYARTIHARFYGVTSTMHIYFDPNNAERLRQDLFKTVENQEATLSQLSEVTKREAKKYSTFFDIMRNKDGTFSFSRDYKKIDNAAKNNGFFCLLTNTSLSSGEVLSIYRRKDVIEKGFDDLKHHEDMKRMHTHNGETTGGKVFCAFISLIAVSAMTNSVRGALGKKPFSKDSIISEMNKIKIVSTLDGSRLMNPVTKTQRLIFESFNITEDRLKSYAAAK